MALADIFQYFRSYDSTSYAVFACQGNEPSEADIVAFEREVGFRLPGEFREFTMSPLGGLYIEVREELWPRPAEFAVGPFCGILVYTTLGVLPAVQMDDIFGFHNWADGDPRWYSASEVAKELTGPYTLIHVPPN